MADPKLERLRALMREEEDKKNGSSKKSSGSGGDNASYPFWNIPEGTSATLRFLPDADDSNPWFWVERQTIRLPFDGIVGGEYPTSEQVTVTVPCVDMFGDTCPIIAMTKPWWREPAKEGLARLYYKKRSFITSGFVVSSPFEEKEQPENPIRRFVLGSSLLAKIKAGLADPDMENHPTDYLNGCDFRIRKTKKQDFNNYDTSEWARRSRPLTEAEHIAINQHGLFTLKEFLGARPDKDGIEMIKAMFHASLNGEPFDAESFGRHYRPFGGGTGRGNADAADAVDSAIKQPKAALTARDSHDGDAAPAVKTTVKEAQTETAPTDKAEPLDLLTKLRQRTGNRG